MKHEPNLGVYLYCFLVSHLKDEMGASENTKKSYETTFSLLLHFAETKLKKPRTKFSVHDIDDKLVGEFLTHLEVFRNNIARSRNARLAAIKSFFKFISVKEPALINHCHMIISIKQKRYEKKVISYLNEEELTAIIDATDPTTIVGRRDAIIIKLMAETGIRVSELTNLEIDKCYLGSIPTITVMGKGGGRTYRSDI